jgi:hypothetical protein
MFAQIALLTLSMSPPREIEVDVSVPPADVVDVAPVEPPPPPPKGEGGPGFLGPGSGPPGYSATWYPNRPAGNAGGDLGFVRQSLTLGAPLWIAGEHRVFGSASVRNNTYFTDVILPDSNRPFPSELWNVSMGLTYSHTFANGWTSAASVNVGSASDKPFNSFDEMNFGFLGFLRIPVRQERDAWMFSLMYSPTSNLNFPIPGVAYNWVPNETFRATIGIPFLVAWTPTPDWSVNLSYFPVTNLSAIASYRIIEGVKLRGGFEWLYEAYFLADRETYDDRFMGFEKRLIGGVRWDVFRKASLDVNAGYAFDRVYGIGQNQLGNLQDEVDVAPGAFLGASFLMRF